MSELLVKAFPLLVFSQSQQLKSQKGLQGQNKKMDCKDLMVCVGVPHAPGNFLACTLDLLLGAAPLSHRDFGSPSVSAGIPTCI